MAYLYRKARSPFWYVVYFDADRKEVHRSTGLRADNPNDTAKAKALRAELEAKEHHRVPVVNSEGWDTWVPKYLERHCESPLTLERYTTQLEMAGTLASNATVALAPRHHLPQCP
jgi:asparagine synthetase B (glutamine-hydrolysing)